MSLPNQDWKDVFKNLEKSPPKIARLGKAIELADGWKLSETGFCAPLIGWCYFPDDPGQVSKVAKDALAAQLVRQVDGIEIDGNDFHSVVINKCRTEVTEIIDQGIEVIAFEDRFDRTMNTIKAIVDSGVLESRPAETGENDQAYPESHYFSIDLEAHPGQYRIVFWFDN